MIRTIISLEKEDKRWLDSYSRSHHVSSAEILRTALRLMKRADTNASSGKIISDTAGLWKNRKVDAVEFVKKIRSEWDERQRKVSG
jgi:hypothetical protein